MTDLAAAVAALPRPAASSGLAAAVRRHGPPAAVLGLAAGLRLHDLGRVSVNPFYDAAVREHGDVVARLNSRAPHPRVAAVARPPSCSGAASRRSGKVARGARHAAAPRARLPAATRAHRRASADATATRAAIGGP